MRTRRVILLSLALCIPSAARAQDGLLETAAAKIDNGEIPAARSLLDRWHKANPNAASEDRARYHLLAGRVTTSADSAEDNYLIVAVTYPTARSAPEALLRLAQARSARGDQAQAITYLERLLSDYPDNDHRSLGVIWLARARSSKASKSELCSLLRSVAPGNNPETVQYHNAEQVRFCGKAIAAKAPASKPQADTTPRPTPAPAPARAVGQATLVPAGRVTIQVGAFRELSGARSTQQQLERAGISGIRLVRVPGNQLIRVRIGKFNDRADASELLARLKRANISAVLVSDAHTETPVKN